MAPLQCKWTKNTAGFSTTINEGPAEGRDPAEHHRREAHQGQCFKGREQMLAANQEI